MILVFGVEVGDVDGVEGCRNGRRALIERGTMLLYAFLTGSANGMHSFPYFCCPWSEGLSSTCEWIALFTISDSKAVNRISPAGNCQRYAALTVLGQDCSHARLWGNHIPDSTIGHKRYAVLTSYEQG